MTDLERGWQLVTATEAGLAFPLPDAAGWRIEAGGRWWHARHAATNSELFARTWSARRASTPDTCERQARLWKPDLPDIEQEGVVEERRLEAPQGYVTRMTVSTGHTAARSMLAGRVTAFGATVGRCLAVIYNTRAPGLSAEDAVAARLAAVAHGVLPAMQRLTVDDRARATRNQELTR